MQALLLRQPRARMIYITSQSILPSVTPPAGGKWLTDGPHIMIFNAKALLDAYPHAVTAPPNSTQPYVMYAGTPYAHLMVPVKPP